MNQTSLSIPKGNRKPVPKIENMASLKAGVGLAEITNIKELDECVKYIVALMVDFKKLNELKGMIDV